MWGSRIRKDSEENILTDPFRAPCISLAQEPAAFTQLSVSRPWSLSEAFYMKVVNHLLEQLDYKRAKTKRKEKKSPASTRCYIMRRCGIFKGRRVGH